jgi:hypothetical protein
VEGQPESGRETGVTRRVLLRDGTAVAVAIMAGGYLPGLDRIAVAVEPGRHSFLNEAELATLRALVDRIVPADEVPGAREAGCAEAIDALLGAFSARPPKIYAGGPFSDRGGSRVNHFDDFLTLDRYERKAWELQIRGSRGRKQLEFNGPVKGWQQIYREGLAALEAAAGGNFAGALAPLADVILLTSGDAAITELMDIAVVHTMQFMYGAPEYGGNRNLVAWKYAHYAGDVQPVGYTRQQIEEPDPPSAAAAAADDEIPPHLLPALMVAAGLAREELAMGTIAAGGGTLSGIREQFGPVFEHFGVDVDGA